MISPPLSGELPIELLREMETLAKETGESLPNNGAAAFRAIIELITLSDVAFCVWREEPEFRFMCMKGQEHLHEICTSKKQMTFIFAAIPCSDEALAKRLGNYWNDEGAEPIDWGTRQ